MPATRSVAAFQTTISWDYDTFLDIAFLLLIAIFVTRFLRTGGLMMLRQMNHPAMDHAPTHDPRAG